MVLADDFTTDNLSSEEKKARCSENFPGRVTTCRVGKTASKALGRGNSIAIVTVVSLVAAFQLLSNNRTPNLFINMKPAEISARHIKIWCVFCSPQCGCSVAVHCIVTVNNKQNTIVSLFPLLALQRCEDAPHSGLSFFGKMSLFRCGFTVQKKKVTERPNNSDASEDLEIAVPAYFPSQESTSLGNVEYYAVESSVASLVNPHSNEGSSATSAARKRGKYRHYSAETCAKIGKYASENGNSKAINQFKEELPTLKESTVRTFKRAYERRLREEKKKGKTDATVIAIPSDTHGRPPILCDLDSILISLLRNIRSRGGVVNFCVVKATALALLDSNKTPYIREFEPTVT